MRLLHLEADGGFSLIERVGDAIPPYAILSHTWGADDDEVTFKDLMEGTGLGKAGYKKLTFCGKQAASDGLDYFWVDTCAIDKSSSAELSEAINSMFQWYRNSVKCYVYLSDVSSDSLARNDGTFQKSRWFKRGWTLQELVAPRSVVFYSSDGQRIGDKNSMVQDLHSITGIDPDALHGAPLSRFSIDEKMAWAAKRDTKREEDGAYCLLGLFEVSMSLIYGEGRNRAFARLRKVIDEVSGVQMPQSRPVVAKWNVPFSRNQHFVGRESYLHRLENMLFEEGQPPAIAITGLGGVGKTQIVIELAHRTRRKHRDCSIFWLPATSVENLQQGYADIARLLKQFEPEQDQVGMKKMVQRRLNEESSGRWLLIIDNIDDMDMWNSELKGFLPRSQQGCVVCTTRNRKIAVRIATSQVIELPQMEEQAAMDLLAESLIHKEHLASEEDAERLLGQIAFLPLAIVQAAAYINENGIMLSDYLSLLEQQEQDVVDLLSEDFEDMGRYDTIKNPVATTWLISFDQIRRQSPLAAEYLSFMSCVDSKAIPKALLPQAATPKVELDAIGILDAYYFVTRRTTDNTFDVHRLVHLAMRNWLRKEGTLVQWTGNAVRRLLEVFPDHPEEKGTSRSVWRSYLPHARSVLYAEVEESFENERVNLLGAFSRCLSSDGRYAEAEVASMEVVQLKQRLLGDEHLETITSKRYLAVAYSDLGKYQMAEELELENVEIAKRMLGDNHPATLGIKGRIAGIYIQQDRWEEAADLQKQVLGSRMKSYGEYHLDTVASMVSMATIYSHQKRWEEAEQLGVKALEIRQTLRGDEDPGTLVSMNDLALTYQSQGRLQEAEEMQIRVVQIEKRVLGENHPETLNTLNGLVGTYIEQERLEEAEVLMKQVIKASEKVLGERHIRTIDRKSHLQLLYKMQKRWEDAEELGVDIVEASAAVFGKEHKDTLDSMEKLANVYAEQKRYSVAEKLYLEVFAIRKQTLGEKHAQTLICMSSLATTLRDLKRREEAISLLVNCIELRKEAFGLDDPSVERSLKRLTRWQNEI